MCKIITYSCLEGYDCVVFDLDGTICDTIGDIERSLSDTFLRYDYPLPDMNRLRVGPPLAVMIDELLGGNVDRDFVDKIAATYRKNYEASNYSSSPLYRGIFELLLKLKVAGKKLAIATLKRMFHLEKKNFLPQIILCYRATKNKISFFNVHIR
jgi:phosphoglycolate phosphatase